MSLVAQYEHRLAYVTGSPSAALWAAAGSPATSSVLDVNIHAGVEVGVVLRGREEIHYLSHVAHCAPGDVWLCAPWEPHGWRVTVSGTRNVVVIFLPALLSDEFSWELPWTEIMGTSPENRWGRPNGRVRREVRAIGEKLASEIERRAPMWEHAVQHALAQLLIEVARRFHNQQPRERGRAPTTDFGRVLPAVKLVQEVPSRRFTAEEAARSCGLSQSRFRHLFSGTMGTSFREFSLRVRLAYCSHLLVAEGDRSLSEIAHRLGFVDQSHLHHAFVKFFGCTPKEFRARCTPVPSRPRPSVLFPAEVED